MRRSRIGAKQFSRRDFLRVGGAGLAGAALLGTAGCGGGGGGQGGGSSEITFSWIPERTGTLQSMIDTFNEQNEDGITVNYREMPTDATQHFDQIRTEFQAGSSEVDVIGSDVTWPAQFAANGYYLDLSDYFPEDERGNFLEAPMEANTWEGAPYGVPWYSDAGMLYYRMDLLEEAGFSEPPTTWEELREMAQQIVTDVDVTNGFVFQGAEYEGGVCNGLEYIWTHGGNVLAESGSDEVVVDGAEAVEGLATYRSMVESGASPRAVTSYTEQESQSVFLGGDAVFMRNWPYIYGLATDEQESQVPQDRIGVAPLPEGPGGQSFSCLGGWNFAINANSQNPDAAWAFISYMTAPEQEKMFSIETARIPALQDLLEDQEIIGAVPVVDVGRQAIQNTRPRPVSPYYSDMSLAMAATFTETLSGDAPAEQAAQELQTELEEIVAQS